MAIERWEMEQRHRGNIAGAEMAKVLRDQYGDVPLPSLQDFSREQPTLKIVRFTPEARQELTERGYAVYALTGQSIKTLRDVDKPFWSTWHQDRPELEAMTSRLSEVAINPTQLFLPGSNRKTLKEQERMVKAFSKDLNVDGVEAVMGEMPDYTELAFSHLDATGVRLFGKDFGYNYARTKTSTSRSGVAVVGEFDAVGGLSVARWYRDRGSGGVFAAPLVVPKAA